MNEELKNKIILSPLLGSWQIALQNCFNTANLFWSEWRSVDWVSRVSSNYFVCVHVDLHQLSRYPYPSCAGRVICSHSLAVKDVISRIYANNNVRSWANPLQFSRHVCPACSSSVGVTVRSFSVEDIVCRIHSPHPRFPDTDLDEFPADMLPCGASPSENVLSSVYSPHVIFVAHINVCQSSADLLPSVVSQVLVDSIGFVDPPNRCPRWNLHQCTSDLCPCFSISIKLEDVVIAIDTPHSWLSFRDLGKSSWNLLPSCCYHVLNILVNWTSLRVTILAFWVISLAFGSTIFRCRVSAGSGPTFRSSSTFSRALRPITEVTPPTVKGSFTYYVISRGGGGGFQMLTVDYGGGGGVWSLIT